MVNRIVLVGRLTRDPELRRTNTTDMSVASFTLAIDDRVKGADGKKVTTYITVTVWGNQADNVQKYCKKGSLVGVDGRIRQRTFEKKDGTKQSVIEVIADSVQFLEPKGSREVPNEEPSYEDEVEEVEEQEDTNIDSLDVTDDNVPF